MKQSGWIKRAGVLALAAALALGVSIPASAQKSDAARVSVPAVCAGAPVSPAGDEEPDKTETVTVKANPDGTARKITVETVLKQQEGEKLVDRTNLRDIRNTEGEEEYTLAADGTLLWDNLGESIHYKGESDAQLPVTVNITYTLDGQPITPEELAGKSGRVGIRFDYENHTEYAAQGNGTGRTVQVPFLAFTALMLDEEKFSDVQVTNGKKMSMDGQAVVLGYAFPGLADSLRLNQYEPTEDVDLPDFVEVTAQVQNFELDFTATVVTNGMFRELEENDLADAEDLADSMDELNDASKELVDGTGELLDGVKEFGGYLEEYTDGVKSLNEGAGQLADGTVQLAENMPQLAQAATLLHTGLDGLNTALAGMAAAPADEEALAAVGQAAKQLEQDAAALQTALEAQQTRTEQWQQYAAQAQSYADQAESGVAAALQSLESAGLSAEDLNALAAGQAQEALEQALAAADLDEERRAQLSETLGEALAGAVDLSAPIAAQQAALSEAEAQLSKVQQLTLPTLPEGEDQGETILALVDRMNQEVETLSGFAQTMGGMSETVAGLKTTLTQLAQLAAGVDEGTAALSQGVELLRQGTDGLHQGTDALEEAGDALCEAMDTLIEGVQALSDGVKTFDEDGIQELTRLAGDDLREVIRRVKAVKQADEAYANFGGLAEGQTGSVKFIIETDEIKH